jgi:hypothetical protein
MTVDELARQVAPHANARFRAKVASAIRDALRGRDEEYAKRWGPWHCGRADCPHLARALLNDAEKGGG